MEYVLVFLYQHILAYYHYITFFFRSKITVTLAYENLWLTLLLFYQSNNELINLEIKHDHNNENVLQLQHSYKVSNPILLLVMHEQYSNYIMYNRLTVTGEDLKFFLNYIYF